MPSRQRRIPHRKAPKRFFLETDVLPGHYYVQFGGTKNSAVQWWAKKMEWGYEPFPENPQALGSFLGVECVAGGLIWFHSHKPTIATVAHECLHATFHTMRVVGVSLTPDSEEGFCYLQDHLISQILKRV